MPKNNKQILEGSRAIALTIKNIAPAVVSAYPITPQTHIVEDLAKFKADGQADYEYIRAESEFAAASIVLGASATGVRTYSATSSQGLLLMTEVIYNIAGMRLPIVMTCANRAISAPINIWCDHSDVMSIRDAGWIQLFAADHQEAVNSHVLAYKLAEKLKLPVMVNVDGYILTHSYESVEIPTPELIKKYLPDYKPATGTYLNPDAPITMGGFFTPAHYMEARKDLHDDLINSLKAIKEEYKNLRKIFGQYNSRGQVDNGLIEYYGPAKPETIIVALGSVIGTIREAAKDYKKIGILKIKTYRPFPEEEVTSILKKAKNVAVIEKALSYGQAGPLYSDIAAAFQNTSNRNSCNLKNYIVGLGGRDVTEKMIISIIKDAVKKSGRLKFIC
jgi:pyruvate ferredoxin oxidoreductase alpha subunit